jgi:CheY-like chemotaxis protein
MSYEEQLSTVIKHDNIFNQTRPIRILLAEDQEINIIIVEKFLKNLPVDIDVAENGKIAIEKFKEKDYDLVLMDLRMPEINGYDAAKEIRTIEKEKGQNENGEFLIIPLFAVSASVTPDEVRRCLESGCNEHLSKPYKKESLFEVILNYYEVIKTKNQLI